MNKGLQTKLKKYVKMRKKKRKWLTVILSLCAVVAMVTSYVLINPADTSRQKTFCGLEEHKEHTDDCYERILVCQLPEEGHTHSEGCYEEIQVLTCALSETDGHTHSDACYSMEENSSYESEETERILACNNEDEEHEHTDECYTEKKILTCQLEESEPHHHNDSCYETQTECTCGIEEGNPHQHSEECYEIDYNHLLCELPIHEHTLQCFSNPEADVETSLVWEQSFDKVKLSGNWNEDVLAIAKAQLGYTESTANYVVQEDGMTMKGYTRYGDWYGNAYGDWCAMFCSFCINYAEVDRILMPVDASCQSWIDKLKEDEFNLYHPAHNEVFDDGTKVFEQEEDKYIPVPGDLIFFDWENYDPEHPEKRDADHIGFVAKLIYDKTKNEIIKIETIEGNSGDMVCSNTYDITDSSILGYGELPENPEYRVRTIESEPASDGAIAVIHGKLPENAQAEITAVLLGEEELIAYFGAEKAALMTGYVAYDIKIMVDGVEWQPDNTVSVTVKHPELDLENGNRLGLAHVADGSDIVTDVDVQKDENGDVVFSADGFSLYILYTSFTVDFRYEDIEYSMNGMESMRLSELFAALGIEDDISDVESAVFSDPALLLVEPTEDGDWLLTSLRAFTTDEMLTVIFADGTEIVIETTDAISTKSAVWDETKKTAKIIVSGKNSSSTKKTIGIQHSSTTTYGTSYDVSKSVNGSSNYTLEYQLPNNTSSINSYKNWRVSGDKTESLGTIYDLMDLISVSSSVTKNYKSAKFSDWLESDYIGKPNYRNPSSPGTMEELMTAFDYFYTGRIEQANVWCYHEGDTEPYEKFYTLYDATCGNTELVDGDIIELHGDTTETKQSVIQNSITLKSVEGKTYTINYEPTGGYLEYGVIYCNKKADGSNVTEFEGNRGFFATRDCITVCPEELGTELEVLFENVVLDGFNAYHLENDIHDYHILQTIHNVELTLSGVTIQNYNIQSNLNSNGAISLDGRSTYTPPSGDTPAQYGNKIILINKSVLKNCNSYRGDPYSTGGIMINSACLEMTDSTIENCSSRNGPAIVVDGYSTAWLHEDTIIQNCKGQEEGAGIRNSGILYIEEDCVIQNCGPQNNYEDTLKGGAVYNKGTLYISGGEIKNCSADEGGAIYNQGTLSVSGGILSDNIASDDPKTYDDASATLGSGVYQNGTMYLSGAPAYDADQDVYLPEGRVITKNGEITVPVDVSVVLEDEVRYRDILISQTEEGKIVDDGDLLKLYVKLSEDAITTTDNGNKYLGAVYSAEGLNNPPENAAKNVVELDISEKLVVTKVWAEDDATMRPESVTIYLHKNGVEGAVNQLTLSPSTGWKGTFTNLEVDAEGHLPYTVSEAPVSGYSSLIGEIQSIRGKKAEFFVPASNQSTAHRTNAFSSGEFVIYGNSQVLYDDNGTLKSKTGPALTTQSLTIGNATYNSYFTADAISDSMVWQATNATTTLTNKDSGKMLDRSSSTISLKDSSSDTWNISSNKLRQGSGSGNIYLNMSNPTSATSSSSGTTVTLYKKVQGPEAPGYYGITITNTKVNYPYDPETGELIGADPKIHKQIDYLGDGGSNPDTNASGDDLYRLYLDMTSASGPLDVLFIVDNSGSMQWTFDSMCTHIYYPPDSIYSYYNEDYQTPKLGTDGYEYADFKDQRLYKLDQILNGSADINAHFANESVTPFKNAQREADGVIYRFLSAHPENQIAVLAYANAAVNRSDGWKTKYDMPNHGATPKDCFINVVPLDEFHAIEGGDNRAGTNYHWALLQAEEQLLRINNSGHQKVVIFMTDGEPNKRVQNGVKDQTKTDVATAGNAALDYLQNTLREKYPDLLFFTVGITTNNSQADNAPEDLLNSMSGVFGENGQAFMVYNENDLSDALINILEKTHLLPTRISDTLEDYVDFADSPELKITMQDVTDPDNPGQPVTIWNEQGETQYNTDANSEKIIKSVTISGKTIDVVFNENLDRNNNRKYTVSYNVQLAEIPLDEETKTGDLDTDYPGNTTSSEQPGFYSNKNAYVNYYWWKNMYQMDYSHPVVQRLSGTDIQLKKVSAADNSVTLPDAEFDLFRELTSATDNTRTYTDGDDTEHYLLKVNGESLVTGADGTVTVSGLFKGTYYLFETEAPSGYVLREEPVVFVLSDDGITTTDDSAEVQGVDSLTLQVENTPKTVTLTVIKSVSGRTDSTAFPFTATLAEGIFPTPAADAEYTVGSDGVAHFELANGEEIELSVPLGADVTICETSHDGYYPLIKVNSVEDTLGDTITVMVNRATTVVFENTSGYKLPKTGGPGTILYTLSGLVLLTGALVYGYIMRRRREKKSN